MLFLGCFLFRLFVMLRWGRIWRFRLRRERGDIKMKGVLGFSFLGFRELFIDEDIWFMRVG